MAVCSNPHYITSVCNVYIGIVNVYWVLLSADILLMCLSVCLSMYVCAKWVHLAGSYCCKDMSATAEHVGQLITEFAKFTLDVLCHYVFYLVPSLWFALEVVSVLVVAALIVLCNAEELNSGLPQQLL